MKSQKKKPREDAKEKYEAKNLHTKIDVAAIVLGALASLFCIIAYIYSLDFSNHNIVSLWLYCLAALFTAGVLCRAAKALSPLFILGGLICVVICAHLQQKWLALDAPNKPTPIVYPQTKGDGLETDNPRASGPLQITDQIESAEPYQRDAVAKSFVNAPVDWKLYLFSIHRSPHEEDKDLLQISLLSEETDGPRNRQVFAWVSSTGNEKLSLLKKGSLIRVRGLVQSADEMSVSLKDGANLEPIKTQ